MLGGLCTVLSMAIQVVAVVAMLRYRIRIQKESWRADGTFAFATVVLSVILLLLFLGHMVQISIWATLFVQLNEFDHFQAAFYHSAVNFSSLGYGDIVMSEKWRLLGALEASNGVLMFGLSAGTMLSVMTKLFARHTIAGGKPEDRKG
ncbi:MAG: two pore domain potassium channel family protein [Mariprofundaceae bacterium]|nr:two pore domain potassium channel family protein [Mariprofundaceae bacterium]